MFNLKYLRKGRKPKKMQCIFMLYHFPSKDDTKIIHLKYSCTVVTIPILGVYPKEIKSAYKRVTYIFMCIAAQFTIAKICDQPRCPSADNRIRKISVCVHACVCKMEWNNIQP